MYAGVAVYILIGERYDYICHKHNVNQTQKQTGL